MHTYWKTSLDQQKILEKEISGQKILEDFKKQAVEVSKPPYVQRTILACISTFCITSSHYALLLWFPEIFQRFAQFEAHFPNETISVCSVSKRLYSFNATMVSTKKNYIYKNFIIYNHLIIIKYFKANTNSDLFGCDSQIDTSVYMDSLWQAIACIPFSILLPMFVDRLGFKFFLGLYFQVFYTLRFSSLKSKAS